MYQTIVLKLLLVFTNCQLSVLELSLKFLSLEFQVPEKLPIFFELGVYSFNILQKNNFSFHQLVLFLLNLGRGLWPAQLLLKLRDWSFELLHFGCDLFQMCFTFGWEEQLHLLMQLLYLGLYHGFYLFLVPWSNTMHHLDWQSLLTSMKTLQHGFILPVWPAYLDPQHVGIVECHLVTNF